MRVPPSRAAGRGPGLPGQDAEGRGLSPATALAPPSDRAAPRGRETGLRRDVPALPLSGNWADFALSQGFHPWGTPASAVEPPATRSKSGQDPLPCWPAASCSLAPRVTSDGSPAGRRLARGRLRPPQRRCLLHRTKGELRGWGWGQGRPLS